MIHQDLTGVSGYYIHYDSVLFIHALSYNSNKENLSNAQCCLLNTPFDLDTEKQEFTSVLDKSTQSIGQETKME